LRKTDLLYPGVSPVIYFIDIRNHHAYAFTMKRTAQKKPQPMPT
jgi:hypothetical protein